MRDTRKAPAALAKVVIGAVTGGWAGLATSAAREGVDYWKGASSPRTVGSIIQDPSEAIYRHGESEGWSPERTDVLAEAAVERWTRHRPSDVEIVRLNFKLAAIVSQVMADPAGLDRDDVEPVRRILSVALDEVLKRIRPEMELVFSQEVLERLEQIIKQTRVQPVGGDFEEKYRHALASSLEMVRLYGVDDADDYRYGLTPSFVLLSGTAAVEPSAASPRGGTLDEVLAEGRRFLVRGEAGFGKTTLLRWIAVQSACKKLSGLLQPWNWRVPFYFQLRDLAPTTPAPEDFPRQFANPVIGLKPQGWVTQQLVDGRGLLLVDGLDEIAESKRKEVRAWLNDLLINFPSTVVVVTTRPAAAANGWLANHGFVDVELQPMTLPEIDAVVEKWFQEAYQRTSNRGLLSQGEDLKWRLRQENLHLLAATPALCTMICRLWAEQRQLPTNLATFIEASLNMLLYKRDMMRGIGRTGDVGLSGDDFRPLLRELAYWLVLNGRFSATEEEVFNTIERTLSLHPGNPSHILHYLEEGVGVLARTPGGDVSFLYLAFQEYLAASAAVAAMHLDLLVRNAHLDSWDRVVVFSAAQHHGQSAAQPRYRVTRMRGNPAMVPVQPVADRVIRLLLQRAERDGDQSRKLALLAVECFGIADRPSELLSVIDPLLKTLVPPVDANEASALAAAGEFVVPYLVGYGSRDEAIVAACVRTLQLIGSDAAETVINDYRSDTRPAVAYEIARWDEYLQARGDQSQDQIAGGNDGVSRYSVRYR